MISINITNQTLTFKDKTYLISSAANGVGNVEGSFCTPLGNFKIAEKIGQDLASNSVLKGRVFTAEIYTPALAMKHPDRDWILTRILWLDGVDEDNKNTKSRYIYIHGAPTQTSMGVIGSKGCIRMHNEDIIELFDRVQIGEDIAIIQA
ncbi:L,D-transpeptidase family protein [Candidatus Thioglobus sp.]|uniref:L,D-transpeptidase family protein n=1 Tax=Candidatus Thioglobus sp. TaxID=2026721 RepID=UPI003D0C46E1